MGGGPILLPTFEEKLSSWEDRPGGNTSLPSSPLGDPQWTHTEEMESLHTFGHTYTHTQPQKTPEEKVGCEQEQSCEPLSLLESSRPASSVPTAALREGLGMGARALKPSTGQAEADRSLCVQGQPRLNSEALVSKT